jgi:carboxymethylenebutenolidase
MGQFITLTAADGHRFAAYEAKPAGKPKGGLVVIQEIFGVNAHIRSVADGYAADGYHVLSPAIFDRVERDYDHGYEPADIDAGRAVAQKLTPAGMLADIAACVASLGKEGKVAIVGYCLGGSLAFLAAAGLGGLAAAVGYYGGMIANNLDKKPKVPVLLHFGDQDPSIPNEAVDKVKASVDPTWITVHVYSGAGHAFNRSGTKSWHEGSAKLARQRSLDFLAAHMA